MRRTETKRDPNPLSPVQHAAIDRLLAGATITATAEALDLSRRTVHRWLKKDPYFLAELNIRRNDLTRTIDAQLKKIATKALNTVEAAIDSGNVTAALAVLRGIGALSGRRGLPLTEDPRVLAARARMWDEPDEDCDEDDESETCDIPDEPATDDAIRAESRNRPDPYRAGPCRSGGCSKSGGPPPGQRIRTESRKRPDPHPNAETTSDLVTNRPDVREADDPRHSPANPVLPPKAGSLRPEALSLLPDHEPTRTEREKSSRSETKGDTMST